MNAEKDDIRLDDLFRKKLESADVMPSHSFNSTLMKKVARREFMTFNPVKINIFYIGGAIVAGIAALLVLSLNNNEIPSDNIFNPDSKSVVTDIYTSTNQLPVIVETSEYSGHLETAVAEAKTPASVEEVSLVMNGMGTIVENNQPVLADINTLEPAIARSEIINREQLIDNRLVVNSKSGEKLFIPSALNGCAPFSVKFAVTLEEIDSCRWNFGGSGVSSEKSPTWAFAFPGEFKVSLEAFSSGKLVGFYSENITVYPRPTARFEINPAQVVIPDDMVQFINYSSGAVRYQWDFGDGSGSQQFEPLHRYKTFDNYTVTFKAYNEYCCADSVILHNAFAGSK